MRYVVQASNGAIYTITGPHAGPTGPAGDPGPAGAIGPTGPQGSAGTITTQLPNGESAPIRSGQPITTLSGLTRLARGDIQSFATVVGIVITGNDPTLEVIFSLGGVVQLTTGQWDAVTGQSGGLSPDASYYLDDVTPGKMTTTPPTTPGFYLVEIGRAISPTILDFAPFVPVLL